MKLCLLSIVSFAAVLSFAQEISSAKDLLKMSSNAFDTGQYEKALQYLSSVNVRNDLDNSDDMKLAFKIRAISFAQTGKKDLAQITIRELLFLDPNYKFDPFDTPESVVALGRIEKAAIEEKNKQLASIKHEAQHESETSTAPQLRSTEATRTLILKKRPHGVTTLFPFGLNHFVLESPVKGGVYLSLQSLGLLTNIAAYWWKQSYLTHIGTNRLKNPDYRRSFNTAQIIQHIGLGTLLVSFTVSVIDAIIRFNRTPSQKIES